MINNENEKIKNIINFYMLANKLKYANTDKKQSVADQIYGSMILATAINSEYNIVNKNKLGIVLKTILFKTIVEKFSYVEIVQCLDDLDFKSFKELSDNFFNLSNKESIFSFHCVIMENELENFFQKFLNEETIKNNSIEELYTISKNYGITNAFGNDENKNFEIFRFYYLNRILKQKVRSAWDKNHWNVSSNRIEKISEHCVGAIALAIAINYEFKFNVDLDKIITTLCIHELGEIKIGDITPFDGITPEKKEEIEHKAIIEVVGNLSNKDNIINLIFELDKKQTTEMKFAHYCDKLEADLQAKVYQEMGCHHPLTEQKNNVVFKSDKIQKMVQNGAVTAFDIWYEWDKDTYIDEPVFAKVLKYSKENNIKSN